MKNTSEMLRDLKGCEMFEKYYTSNRRDFNRTDLSSYLNDIIARKGLRKSDVIRRSELSEVYGYQIFGGLRRPERDKLLSLLIGMELKFDEIQLLFKSCGYAPLYAKDPRDAAIIFAVLNRLSVAETNELLEKYGFASIG